MTFPPCFIMSYVLGSVSVQNTRALYGSALENRSKWYGLGVSRFFKRCGIRHLSLRYMMVRLPTSRFFKWYLVTVSQHCGKQMALYMVTIFLCGGQMARYMVTVFLRGRQMARYMVQCFVHQPCYTHTNHSLTSTILLCIPVGICRQNVKYTYAPVPNM